VGWLGLVLLLLLAPAAPAAAAIALVSSASAPGTNIGAASPWYLNVNVNIPGNTTVVVAVAVKNTAVIPSSVTDSGGSVYLKLVDQLVNVNVARVQLWVTVAAGAKNSTWVRVNTCCTGTDMVAAVASYSGVVSLGAVGKAFSASASTTAPISVTTSDANNWVVAAMATGGSASLAASTGNLRQSAVANATVGGALIDNTSATPAAVGNTLTTGSAQWTAIGAVELRTVPAVYNIGSSSGSNAGTCNAGTPPAVGIDLAGKVNVVIVAFGSSSASVTGVRETIPGTTYTQQAAFNGSTTARVEIWTGPVGVGASGSVLVDVSPTNSKTACILATYVGVAAIGTTTTASGTTSNPSTAALTTQDPSNVVVGGFAWTGTTPATSFAGGGTFRLSVASTGSVAALVDNTSATAGSLTTKATHSAVQWAAAAVELRAPRASWNYTTGGANMAPPALDPWSNIIVAGSNDNKLHVLADTDGTQKFAPFAGAAGPIASRPTVIPASYSSTGLNVAYFGSQDGYVYAVNTVTGAQLWKSALLPTTGGMIQGGVGIGLKAVGLTGVTNDLIFAGTSNVSSDTNYKIDNKVYALDGNTGAIVWTFNPGNMDIISSTPYVDYANSDVWVTSRSNGNAQPSVWKLDATTGALLAKWSKTQSLAALGDIDGAPNGSADGSVIYVGTNGGTINAIKTGASYTGLDPAGSIVTYTPVSTAPCNCTGAGTVKMPWWLSFNSITAGTPDTIIFSRNATVHSVNFNGTTFTANWTVTPTGAPTSVSGPVDDGVNTYIYIGASDGKVHQLQKSNGTDTKQLPVSASTPTLGDPTFNADLNLLYVGGTDGRTYTFTVPLP
jgi:outer membrane protein assembly factor BamB